MSIKHYLPKFEVTKEQRENLLVELDRIDSHSINQHGLAPTVTFKLIKVVKIAFERIDQLEKENNDYWHRNNPESMGEVVK